MTYSRPGAGTHVVNTSGAAIDHNQAVKVGALTGVAIKQKNPSWTEGYGPGLKQIANNERFWLVTKGIVQLPTITGATAKGDPVYINGSNVLSGTNTGTKFGRVVEVPGDSRGVPTGFVRVDMDLKDSI